MKHNLLLLADSYKFSQFNQMPPGTEYVYSYIESRGGRYDETVFFGLQGFLMEYLNAYRVTREDIDEAEELITAHGEPFNREGWEYILKTHAGVLPVMIKAVDEGTVVPTSNVLVTIINTDPKCYWLTSFLETILLQAVWYPTTVATNSRELKKIILRHLEKSGDPAGIEFKLHDFGFRGVSSVESAGIGGAAHLVNFKGTDTVPALQYLRRYYGADMAGFSIPAMEHSTVTSWGRENEVDSYRNMVKKNLKSGGLAAAVSDSYDIYEACRLWGTELKQDVIDSGGTLVVRPDSGEPDVVVLNCVKILDKHFGSEVNEKGYKVLNYVRVIQGDGIDEFYIDRILEVLEINGYSADNVAFGMGGALLQIVNRDDQKFAMKCSAVRVDGEWRDVYKDPITDPGKKSKRGRLALEHVDGKYSTISTTREIDGDLLKNVYLNGVMTNVQNLEDIRARAAII